MEFYCYSKCSTCQKAKKKLIELGISFEEKDIVNNYPSKEKLIELMATEKYPIRRFFNTSGKLYRDANLKDKIASLSIEEAASILDGKGMLMKRPILITENDFFIGYDESEYEKLK